MAIDFIGDFLTIIRNATMVSKPSIETAYSKMRFEIANILLQEGFVKNVTVVESDRNKKRLVVDLKYAYGESVIHQIVRISSPGLRIYRGIEEVEPVINGLGIAILTTSQGILSNKMAKKRWIGGEVICTVW